MRSPAGAVLSVAYVGNADYHQRDEREINDVPLTDPNRAASRGIPGDGHYNANLDRPYLGYGNIVLGENASNTHYESLQVNFRVENQHGLTFQAAYTWSHSLGIAPGGGGDFNTLSDPYNRYYDYGPTGLDRRQLLVLNYIYDLPIFRNNKGLAGTLLGGWEFAGITLIESGLALNPTLSYTTTWDWAATPQTVRTRSARSLIRARSRSSSIPRLSPPRRRWLSATRRKAPSAVPAG